MATRVVAYVPDLMDRSRVTATRPDVDFVATPAELADSDSDADLVLADVSRPGVLDAVSELTAPVIGFAPTWTKRCSPPPAPSAALRPCPARSSSAGWGPSGRSPRRDHRGSELARYRSVVTLNVRSKAPPYFGTTSAPGITRADRSRELCGDTARLGRTVRRLPGGHR